MNTTHQVNKTKWRGKSAAIVTAAAMLLALFPHGGTAYAADAYTPYGDAYAVQAEGATGSGDPWYYDVYGKGSRTLPASSADLFKKALESEQRTGAGAFPSYPYSYGSDRPLASYWHNLSKAVSMSKYRGDADPLRILKDNASDLKPRTYYYAPFNNSVAVTQADSVKAAAESIKNLTVDYNNGVTTASVPQSLLDNNTNQPVFYKTQRVYVANLDEAYIVSVGIQASMEKMGHLPGRTYTNIANTINTHVYLSTIFYDFKLGYLNSAGQTPTAREGNSGYSFTTDGSGDTYMSLLTNDSAQSVSRTETLESSDTISVSSSVESTKNYSISSERTIGAKVSVGQDIPVIGTKFSAEVSTEFKNSESYSTANTLGNTQGQGKTLNHSSSATVTLPPYTEQMVKQSTENLLLNVAYDYPVHISYKVMTIYSSAQAEGNENEKYEITGRFGDVNYPDAVSNLKARLAQQGNSSVYSDGISVDWSNVTSSSNVLSSTHSPTYPVGTNFINGSMSVGNHAVFCQYRPMSVAGGKLSVGSKGKSTVLKEILSIYPLSEVRADANEYRLKTGEYKWVSDIGVEGYSTKGAPYYGFDKNYGHWSLVGADGTPDSADSAIATLMADSVSNKFKLTAGEKSGTVWLKYFIDEDRYTTSKSSDVFAANDSLEETAIIPVHVTGSDNAGGGDTGGGDVGDGDKSGVGKGDSDKTGDGNGDGGKQTASKSGDLAIAGTDESGIRITIPNKPITGKAVKPTVIIIDGGKKLVQGKDYTITYSGNNVKIGKYKVTIKALPGSVLTGSVTMWYKIVPTKPDKVTIVAKKKALKIKFKTIKEAKAQGVNTYLVYYKQKGAKLWLKKKVAVKKWAKSGELTLTRLKGDKIYQVKLAAFKTIKKGAAKGTYTSAATKVYSKKTRK